VGARALRGVAGMRRRAQACGQPRVIILSVRASLGELPRGARGQLSKKQKLNGGKTVGPRGRAAWRRPSRGEATAARRGSNKIKD
jgi:hypothetical protein